MNEHDRETKPGCPACDGTGFLTLAETGRTHRGVLCDLCAGEKFVSKAVARAYRLGQKHSIEK